MPSISVLKKIALTFVAGTLATLGTVAVGAGAANASSAFTVRLAPVNNPFVFVEVQGASRDSLAPIELWHWTGGSNQVWTFVPTAGLYEIVNGYSGKCMMNVSGLSHRLVQAPCTGSPYQLWSIDQSWINGDFSSSHGISNPQSGLYMDLQDGGTTDGTYVDVYYRTYADNQQFLAERA
jgi:hypothetical protein